MIQLAKATLYRTRIVDPAPVAEGDAPPRRATRDEREKAARDRAAAGQEAIEDDNYRRQAILARTAKLRAQRLRVDAEPAAARPAAATASRTTAHKFRVEQRVNVVGSKMGGSGGGLIYKVSRQLPADASDRKDLRYRITSIATGQERQVNESELVRSSEFWS